jgi:DNA-binding transcriptional regulator YhcF (GntR family)
MMVIQLGPRIISKHLRDKRRSLVTAEGSAMTLQVSSLIPIPLYYQTIEQLRQQIHSSALKPGDILPGEGRICLETGLYRMTASYQPIQEQHSGHESDGNERFRVSKNQSVNRETATNNNPRAGSRKFHPGGIFS